MSCQFLLVLLDKCRPLKGKTWQVIYRFNLEVKFHLSDLDQRKLFVGCQVLQHWRNDNRRPWIIVAGDEGTKEK